MTNLVILQEIAVTAGTAATTIEVAIEEATEKEEIDAHLPEVDHPTEVVEIEVVVAKTDARESKRKVFASSASKRVILKGTALK